nr:hypothetical protein [uncultured bacterium]
MKLNIDAQETPANWGVSDLAPALEIYADQPFDTDDGKHVFAGSVEGEGDFRHRAVGAVENEIAVFPSILGVYSTEDSLTDQEATYSAYIRVKGREPIPWLLNFPLAPLAQGQTSVSWTQIRIHARQPRARRDGNVYTRTETDQAIAAFLLAFQQGKMPSDVALMVDGVAEVQTGLAQVTSRVFASSMDGGITGV